MTTTKRSLTSRLAVWLGAAALAAGLSGTALAATGITNTKHNLTDGGPGTNKTAGTDQICVFCHTPHGSNTGAAVPLWNKAFPGTAYAVYNSVSGTATSSIDGEILAVGSVSLACLSCHDGTQAMDNMLNTPGSGTIAGAGTAATGSAGYTWSGSNKITGLAKIGDTGGTDLTNDHPIGIEYCGGGLTGATTTVSGTCADTDFIGASSVTTSDGRTGVQVKTKEINSKQVFWVDVDGAAGRGKGDIQLYTRDFAGAAGTPSVECGSCHDPHVEAGTNGISFMRVTTAGSKICLSCHIK